MKKTLGVLILHGMGSQDPGYSKAMQNLVEKRIRSQGGDPSGIVWEEVYWADVTEKNEDAYLGKIKGKGLNYFGLRKFVVKALGDAVAYQKVPQTSDQTSNQTYDLIHARIRLAMSQLHENLGKGDAPLVIMAHSLGTVVISNYIWDAQKPEYRESHPFHQFDTLRTLITFGSNLPLFSFAYENPEAIKPPDSCKWYNYYSKADILGYPLKPISDSYNKAVTEDIPICVGGPLTSWNPFSHGSYWEDHDFVKATSKHLMDCMK